MTLKDRRRHFDEIVEHITYNSDMYPEYAFITDMMTKAENDFMSNQLIRFLSLLDSRFEGYEDEFSDLTYTLFFESL